MDISKLSTDALLAELERRKHESKAIARPDNIESSGAQTRETKQRAYLSDLQEEQKAIAEHEEKTKALGAPKKTRSGKSYSPEGQARAQTEEKAKAIENLDWDEMLNQPNKKKNFKIVKGKRVYPNLIADKAMELHGVIVTLKFNMKPDGKSDMYVLDVAEHNPVFPFDSSKASTDEDLQEQARKSLKERFKLYSGMYADWIIFIEDVKKKRAPDMAYSYSRRWKDSQLLGKSHQYTVAPFDEEFAKRRKFDGKYINSPWFVKIPLTIYTYNKETKKKEFDHFRTIRLQDSTAPLIDALSSNQWNMNNGKCVIDWLSAKGFNRKVIQDLFSDHITLEDLVNFLKDKCNYCFVGPDMRVIVKDFLVDNYNYRLQVVAMINNNHIYPIENPDFVALLESGEKLTYMPDYKTAKYVSENSLAHLIEELKVQPLMVKFRGPNIVAMQVEHQDYVANIDHEQVKHICEQFNLEFLGQSLNEVVVEVIENGMSSAEAQPRMPSFKFPRKSQFSERGLKRFLTGNLKPLTHYYSNDSQIQSQDLTDSKNLDILAIDIAREHTACLFKRQCLYPVYHPCDLEFQRGQPEFDSLKDSAFMGELPCGRYRLADDIELRSSASAAPWKVLSIGTTIDSELANYLLKQDIISFDQLSHWYRPSKYIEPKVFADLVSQYYTSGLDDKFLKLAFNQLVGYFGKMERAETSGFLSTDKKFCESFKDSKINTVAQLDNYTLYSVTKTTSSYILENHRPIYQAIIDQTFIFMNELIKKYQPKRIIAIKTDCLIAEFSIKPNSKKPQTLKPEDLGNEYLTDFKLCPTPSNTGPAPMYEVHNHSDHEDFTEIEPNEIDCLIKNNIGFMLTGSAGYGKSYLVLNKIIPLLEKLNKSYLVLTVAHKAGEQYHRAKRNHLVLAQYLFENRKPKHYDYLLIDEFSMVTSDDYAKLSQLKSKFILIGDINQAEPVEKYPRDYSKCPLIRELCDYRMCRLTKSYRNSNKLKDVAVHLLQTGKLLSFQSKTRESKDVPLHICYLNDTVNRINKELIKKHKKDRYAPHICLTNNSELSNGQLYMYDRKLDCFCDYDTLEPIKITLDAQFTYAYAITAHKLQGSGIKRPIVIHDIEKMSKNLLYTAITRAESLEQISLDHENYQELTFSKKEFVYPFSSAHRNHLGGIYRLYKNNQCVYVGQVKRYERFAERLEEHKVDKEFDGHSCQKFEYYSENELFDEETRQIEIELEKKSPLLNVRQTKAFKDKQKKRAKLVKAMSKVELPPSTIAFQIKTNTEKQKITVIDDYGKEHVIKTNQPAFLVRRKLIELVSF